MLIEEDWTSPGWFFFLTLRVLRSSGDPGPVTVWERRSAESPEHRRRFGDQTGSDGVSLLLPLLCWRQLHQTQSVRICVSLPLYHSVPDNFSACTRVSTVLIPSPVEHNHNKMSKSSDWVKTPVWVCTIQLEWIHPVFHNGGCRRSRCRCKLAV